MKVLNDFINGRGCFERGTDRAELGNIITMPDVAKVLVYEQMDYYVPIKIK